MAWEIKFGLFDNLVGKEWIFGMGFPVSYWEVWGEQAVNRSNSPEIKMIDYSDICNSLKIIYLVSLKGGSR